MCVRTRDVTSGCDIPKAPRSPKPQRVQCYRQPPDGARVQSKGLSCGFSGWLCVQPPGLPLPTVGREPVCLWGLRKEPPACWAPVHVHRVASLCTWHLPPSHDHLGMAHTACPANPGFPGLCVRTSWWVGVLKQTPSSLPTPQTLTFPSCQAALHRGGSLLPTFTQVVPFAENGLSPAKLLPILQRLQSKTHLLLEAHQIAPASAHFPHHPLCTPPLTTHCPGLCVGPTLFSHCLLPLAHSRIFPRG